MIAHLIIGYVQLLETRKLEAREQSQGCVGHVQALQLVLDSQEGVWIDPHQGISGQAEPKEVWHAAEGLVVDHGDPVVGQVEDYQALDLVELRVRDGGDAVA